MCAIVGLLNGGRRQFQKRTAAEMLAEMKSRGPDSSSIVEFGEGVIFGHNRLAIVGGEDAVQPIVADGVMLAANGEIYNWKELRDEFRGREWRTQSDCEVLIPLYEKYGIIGMLRRLEGEFAFILYDSRKNVTYAARDRFGVKPLFFMEKSQGREGVAIASELKAFKSLPRFSMEINWAVAACCLGMHYPPLSETIVKDVYSVPPGGYVEVRDGRTTARGFWWKPAYPAKKCEDLSEAEVDAVLREAFVDAVRKRIPDDVEWCTALSGGFDSSAVLGVASRLARRKVRCYTVVFPDAIGSAYDELAVARRTAEFNDAELVEVPMEADKAIDSLADAIAAGEGFCVNGHISGKLALAAAMHRDGNKVALVGEGADECLLGYSHLKVDMFGDGGSSLMHGTETAAGALLETDAFSKLPYIPSFLKAKLSTGKKVFGLLTSEFKSAMLPRCFDAVSKDILRAMTSGNDRAEMTVCAWLATTFPNYICKVLGDGCEMASSIEGRLPFLDTGLWSVASSLPTSMKMSRTSEKIAMRRALRDLVTQEVRERPKQPFQAPPISALCSNGKWKDFVDCICTAEEDANIVDNARLRRFMLELKTKSPAEQAVDEPAWMLLASYKILVRRLFA